MVPRVNDQSSANGWGAMADNERSAAAGHHDTQAPAETDGGNGVAPHIVTTPPAMAGEGTPQSSLQTDTRRTSQSSRVEDSMQASQPSLQSGPGEQGERPRGSEREGQRRNRPQVARLDYGKISLLQQPGLQQD